jgi:aminoglycoside phosphotransferase (APT) family kinase protein
LSWGDAVPNNLFESLAALHARYTGHPGLPAVIPRVVQAWWTSLGQDWVPPRLNDYAARHPADTTARAQALISRVARLPAVSATLERLPATLVHGDVHPGNVLVSADQATLIDWGSCRVGPAALDLANLVTADSPSVARYAEAWQRITGQPLSRDMIELGYRWAALQIPVQYLPWIAAHRATGDYEAALDRIEEAADDLSQGP